MKRRQPQPPALLGIDTGGTFTDCLALIDGRLYSAKLPSRPAEPAAAVLEFLTRTLPLAGAPLRIVHGSTIATNALLERRGARTALVTTRGFADLLDIGRQDRPRLYDLHVRRPAPLVPSELRFTLAERVLAGGAVETPLDGEELALLAPRLRNARAEAVAVCLLFSPENDAHERAVGEALAPLGIPIVRSAEVLPELREYERFSTAVASAYVAPAIVRHHALLAERVAPARLFVMGSDGAALPWRALEARAIETVLSGPAAGVTAAAALSAARRRDLASFDMGGTSTDVALVVDGRVARTRRSLVGGLPIAVPVVEVHTVGAGGGSQAWIDGGGALRVGPRSSGADPGPICYGRGGEVPTVTDAHVFLGRLPCDVRLGGELPLSDFDRVARAFETLASRLGSTPPAAALGVITVVEAEMERALRRVTQERGVDPRGLALLSFGGAGGLHAVALARALGMREVLVPPAPGLFCARGALAAPVQSRVAFAAQGVVDARVLGDLARRSAELERRALRELLTALDESSEGVEPEIARELSLRYAGQSHELDVAWVDGEDPRAAFLAEYRARYGETPAGGAIEVTSVRSRISIPSPVRIPVHAESVERHAGTGAARAWIETGPRGAPRERKVARILRATLRAADAIAGPAIIEESSGTLWLPVGARLRAARDGCLEIEAGA